MKPAKEKPGLLQQQAHWLNNYQLKLHVSELGAVVSVGDGITWVSGLPSAAIEDILLFEDGSKAMVFDLNQELIGAILLHDTEALTAGTVVHLAKKSLSVPVGDAFLTDR